MDIEPLLQTRQAPAWAAGKRGAPVTILLSTYNGEAFLPRQLESFLEQVAAPWRLIWRDDGSADASPFIMQSFAREIGPERCVQSPSSGPHLGAARSFMLLLSENRDAPYLAFADQDDCWLPGKLRRSLQMLGDADGPAMYCARQILTDDDFSHPTLSMKFREEPGFPACLTQNVATGNTVVMNRAAARLISAIPAPDDSPHDWWSYIVVSAAGGSVIYDAEPSMLYRQHAKNMVGSQMPVISRAIAALERGPGQYMDRMRLHADRLWEHREKLHPLAVADLQLIQRGLAGSRNDKLAALRCPSFRRATMLENFLFRVWFLFC